MATESSGPTAPIGDQVTTTDNVDNEDIPNIPSSIIQNSVNLNDDERCTVSPSQDGDVDNQEDMLPGDTPVDEEDGNTSLTLLTLPPEIIWYILAFIDARFVIQQLSLVSKEFYKLVNDDVTWKVRISKRFPKRYPIIPGEYALWKQVVASPSNKVLIEGRESPQNSE